MPPNWSARTTHARGHADRMTDDDRALLEFEEQHPRDTGRKDAAIAETFGLSPARYYQRLLHVVGQSDALEAYPMLVKRVLRRQTAATEARARRSLGAP